jgi:hypothetical protein
MDETRPHKRTRGARRGARLNAVAGGMPSIEGGRGAIKKKTVQIKKSMVRQPTTKVSMMGVVDNRVGSGQ